MDDSNPAKPRDPADPPDAAERAVFTTALKDGAFGNALRAYQHGQARRALALLEAEKDAAS